MTSKTLLFLCATFFLVKGQLWPKDPAISDGPCRPIQNINKSEVAFDFNAQRVYVVNLASETTMRTFAALFLGRPANNKKEMMKMCLNFMFTNPLTFLTGYTNRSLINIATFNNKAGNFLRNIIHSPGVDMNYQKLHEENFIWFDGSNHTLISQCINGEYMGWKLISLSVPTDEIIKTALNVLVENGFDPSHAVDTRQINCDSLVPTSIQAITQASRNVGWWPSSDN